MSEGEDRNNGEGDINPGNSDESRQQRIQLKEAYIQERTKLYGQVQRLKDTFNKEVRISSLQIQMEKVRSTFEKFDEVQTQIEKLSNDEEADNHRELFEQFYYDTIGEAVDIIQASNQESKSEQENKTKPWELRQQEMAEVKLPALKLPTFDGNFNDWLMFKDSFEANIGTKQFLTDSQKFQYLRGQLKDRALQLIQNLETGDSSYETAWQLLRNTYEDKRLLTNIHLKALFELNPIGKVNHDNLQKFLDTLQAHIRSLEKLESKVDGWGNMMLIHLIQEKLDYVTKRDWAKLQESKSSDETPTFEDLISFLRKRCKTLFREESDKSTPVRINTKKMTLTSNITQCEVCNSSHKIYYCPNFLKLPIKEKQQKIKSLQLCLNCLGKGHIAKNCSSSKCKKCGKMHNTLLHEDQQEADRTKEETTEQKPVVTVQTTHGLNKRQSNYVLLATAVILIQDNQGNFHQARALLDPGSQASYISEDLVKKLKLQSRKTSEVIAGITSTTMEINKETTIYFKSRINEFQGTIQCLNLNKITQNLPSFPIDENQLKIPIEIQLADPKFYQPAEVQLLIGADIVWSLLCNDQIRFHRNLPILQKTELGWIVSGPLLLNKQVTRRSYHAINLENQVQRFWKQEEIETSENWTHEEQQCENHFLNSYEREDNGRFVVRLPMADVKQLGSSTQAAKARLNQLEKRFRTDSQLKQSYREFMNEYEELNHMQETSIEENNTNSYFMPHQPVIREQALTTKLRVVFDASAKTSTGVSLNEVLLKGPTIQSDVMTILTRFRIHQFVMNADIEKMFRQINVHPEDQCWQRIFWRSEESQPIKIYNLTTVTYGTTCAPFLATRCLQQLALEDGHLYKEAKEVVENDFYMDDLLTGTHTKEEAKELQEQLVSLLQKGQFKLRKWRFNDEELRQYSKNLYPNDELHMLDEAEAKTLGMLWNSKEDTFQFVHKNTVHTSNEKISKRTILSTIAQLYDPLGLMAPILVNAKIILKEIWECQLEWDEKIPDYILQKWKKFIQNLQEINQVKIPRNINPHNTSRKITLHGFCDASPQAYGACVYSQSTDEAGNKIGRLICAKSRVSPKNTTLPRLELNGAVLLVRLIHKVAQAFPHRIKEFHAWTDSTIVLAWISSSPKNLQIYVANRVTEIQNHSHIEWRHVNTESNPADLLTRQSYHQSFQQNYLWWDGPHFLADDDLPIQPTEIIHTSSQLEMKKVVMLTATNQDSNSILKKVSSFKKLRRIIATCLRWKTKLRKQVISNPFSCEELQKAELIIMKLIQQECFYDEIERLKRNQPVSIKSKLFKLNPYLDEDNVIRIQGRLHYAEISPEAKNPIAIPKHFVSELMLRKKHNEMGHCGSEQLLNEIRQTHWPIFGRRIFKKITKSCLQCYKVKPKPIQYQLGHLPSDRVNSSIRPFMSTGVDYAGPIMLKERKSKGRKTLYKAYIALFICMTTKAVHLEIVTELTTEAFLACLTRFTARRGICHTLNSDNATTFVGANKVLQELQEFLLKNETYIEQELAERGITWKFIPPRAPHFGGLWESNIKSMKAHMNKITQGILLTFEECMTLLATIEACLNSRPLTPISDDPSDLKALTPAHFLIGGTLLQPMERDVSDIPRNRLSRWQHLQQLKQHYWQRWQQEYLHQLQTRAKWHKKYPNVKIGDMVLIMEDNLPPLKWSIGRILDVHPGVDGVVRVVTVKTPTGSLKRSVNKLSLLPFCEVRE